MIGIKLDITTYSMLYKATTRCLLPVVLLRKKPDAMPCEQNQICMAKARSQNAGAKLNRMK